MTSVAPNAEQVVRPGGRKRRAFALVALGFCLIFLIALPPRGNSHEPITTNVTFNKEIVRIFQRSCMGCHGAHSLVGIPLMTYGEARPWAKAIKEEVLEKRMPPFQAVKGFGRFHNNYALSQRELDLIVSWVEGGAPKGEEKDYPSELTDLAETAALRAWPLGAPDLLLQPTPEVELTGNGTDEYRCFALPAGLKEDKWLVAFDFRPGNPAVVHCVSVVLDRTAHSKMLDIAGPSTEDCQSRQDSGPDSLGVWVPGQLPSRWPGGVAQALPAGARLLLKVHYRPNGAAPTDRSALGLYFAGAPVTKQLRSIPITAPEVTLAAGATRQRVKASYLVSTPAEAIGIRPKLFPFGQSVEATAFRPDGTVEVLIWAKNYRTDWQPVYYFQRPVSLPQGTRVEVTAYLDNSASNRRQPHNPAQAVRFNEPLCELFLATPTR